jgi:integration host factor subunit alpha
MSDKTVTRADLATALHQAVGLSRSDCRRLVDDVFDEINRSLVDDGEAKLSSFGSFTLRHKRERLGRNPKTGEEAVVSARRVVVFTPAQKLKSQVAVRSK